MKIIVLIFMFLMSINYVHADTCDSLAKVINNNIEKKMKCGLMEEGILTTFPEKSLIIKRQGSPGNEDYFAYQGEYPIQLFNFTKSEVTCIKNDLYFYNIGIGSHDMQRSLGEIKIVNDHLVSIKVYFPFKKQNFDFRCK